MQEYKKPTKYVLLEIGTLSLGLGISCIFYFPCFWSYIIAISGIYALVQYGIEHSKFDKLFVGAGLGTDGSYPIEKGHENKDGYTQYEFTLPVGMSSEDFAKKELAISQWLGKEIAIQYGYKNLLLRVYDEPFKHDYQYTVTTAPGDVPVLIGHDRGGKLIFADLAKGEPHMIIAGETGSGKSTALRAIIVNLIITARVEFYLIDLKYGAELGMFKDCRKVKEFARTREEAETLLSHIREEVGRRYDTFAEAGCPDIKAYTAQHGRYMRRQVLIIDEFADLMTEKKSIQLIENLTAMARACGIHIILCTQRPDAKVLNGRIKSNCAVVLGLKTSTDINSRIIIDDGGLEKLAGKGHGLFKRGGALTEVQVPYLSVERATELIKPYIEVKKPAPRVPKLKDIFSEIGGE